MRSRRSSQPRQRWALALRGGGKRSRSSRSCTPAGCGPGKPACCAPSTCTFATETSTWCPPKGNRSRRLPLTGEVTEVLADCDRVSVNRFGPSRRTFFVSATGNQVTAATVGKIFHRVWDQASLPRPTEGQQPRPYDFRHHFAYANVERWMAQGRDVTAMLPYLARYMGHASIESSYYYIHTSPEFLHAYATITSESQSPLPEVGFDET